MENISATKYELDIKSKDGIKQAKELARAANVSYAELVRTVNSLGDEEAMAYLLAKSGIKSNLDFGDRKSYITYINKYAHRFGINYKASMLSSDDELRYYSSIIEERINEYNQKVHEDFKNGNGKYYSISEYYYNLRERIVKLESEYPEVIHIGLRLGKFSIKNGVITLDKPKDREYLNKVDQFISTAFKSCYTQYAYTNGAKYIGYLRLYYMLNPKGLDRNLFKSNDELNKMLPNYQIDRALINALSIAADKSYILEAINIVLSERNLGKYTIGEYTDTNCTISSINDALIALGTDYLTVLKYMAQTVFSIAPNIVSNSEFMKKVTDDIIVESSYNISYTFLLCKSKRCIQKPIGISLTNKERNRLDRSNICINSIYNVIGKDNKIYKYLSTAVAKIIARLEEHDMLDKNDRKLIERIFTQ